MVICQCCRRLGGGAVGRWWRRRWASTSRVECATPTLTRAVRRTRAYASTRTRATAARPAHSAQWRHAWPTTSSTTTTTGQNTSTGSHDHSHSPLPASNGQFTPPDTRDPTRRRVGVGLCERDNYFKCVRTPADCRRFNSHRQTWRSSTVGSVWSGHFTAREVPPISRLMAVHTTPG